MSKLISVIVPIYNAEKYISKCIESIINQTYRNLEIILINDGSKDKSLDICMKYKNIDKRIKVINKENEGVSLTRNYGIKIAKGDFIGFVDSDDSIDENMYENLLGLNIKNNTGISSMIGYTIKPINKILKNNEINLLSSDDALKELLLMRFPTSLWAYLYSKELIRDILLDDTIHFFEDLEFNLKVLSKGVNISLCRRNLYNYNNNNNESINSQKISKKRMSCLKIDKLLMKGNYIDKNNMKFYTYTKAHFIISIITSISKTPKCNENYYCELQDYISENFIDIILSSYVPFSYKATCIAFYMMPKKTTKIINNIKYKKVNKRGEL